MPQGIPGLPVLPRERARRAKVFKVGLAAIAITGLIFWLATGRSLEPNYEALRQERIALLEKAGHGDYLRFDNGVLCQVDATLKTQNETICRLSGYSMLRLDNRLPHHQVFPVEVIRSGTLRWAKAWEAWRDNRRFAAQ